MLDHNKYRALLFEKYLYANANPVMNTDPTGYFSLMDTTLAQGIQSTIDSVIVPYFNVKKIMSWANMAVTAYDVAQQIRMIYAGEASILGLTFALAKGFIVQSLITCAATAALGEAAVWVLKAVNISMDSVSFVEAVKSGDPEKIIVESLRLSVSLFTLTCQCFTGETLVSTEKGETRIDEIKPGDMVWSYDTEKGENVLKKVTKVKESETDVIVHVKTSDGKDINTTMFHPFMTEKEGIREWKAASNLQKGDNLITETGESVYVEEVRVEKLAESVTVYNLEVEDLHVYYVAGVMVHNICGSETGKYQVGAYEDIKGCDGLDAHHVGQKAVMNNLVDNYNQNTAPAINVPKVGHTISGPNGIVSRSTKGITNARQLLARDLFELKRVYPDIPNSAFRELIDMNLEMYPEMRK